MLRKVNTGHAKHGTAPKERAVLTPGAINIALLRSEQYSVMNILGGLLLSKQWC